MTAAVDSDFTTVLGRATAGPTEFWVDRYAAVAGRYVDVKGPPVQGVLQTAVASGNIYMFTQNSVALPAGVNSAVAAFDFDPAHYAVPTKTTKCILKAMIVTNAVAPAVTFAYSLFPVATYGGASGAAPTVATLAAYSGTVNIATPAAAGRTVAEAKFTAPAAGAYVLAVASSGTNAANSQFTHFVRLLAGAE